jgi:glycosyltransferase involved in cell wall biosynthesis
VDNVKAKIFLLDPLESLHGPLRPPFLLAKELKGRFEIIFVSPFVSEIVDETLRSEGIELLSLNKRYLFHGSLLTFEAWLRRCTFKAEDGIVINFSQCFLADAHVYYAQGPITKALDDMYSELKALYKLAYKIVRPFLVRRDKRFNEELRRRSRVFIANSRFCASMYENWGIKVDDIIYPPLDCEQFKSTTSRPSSDYVLAYVGKETKYSVLKRMTDLGVKIKAFGSKAPYIPKRLLKHPNVEFLGRVSDEELIDLYSNALYTLFTFAHEPFGYVPVESMACGTPVLTYNRQGPRESVINGVTGWLADSDEELVDLAVKIWREGYPSWMRSRCRERALEFDVKAVAERWLEIISGFSGF